MRKESVNVARAFLARRRLNMARTRTDGEAVYLHGNKIAWHNPDGSVSLTLAGWGTVTTRDRLNTICALMGKGKPFHPKARAQYFDGEIIDSRDVIRPI